MRHHRQPLTPPRSQALFRRCAGLAILLVLAHEQIAWALGWLVVGVFVLVLLVGSLFQ
jgi:hypothetical protein